MWLQVMNIEYANYHEYIDHHSSPPPVNKCERVIIKSTPVNIWANVPGDQIE